MADLSESIYGDGLYGGGYYSYKPIWLFASDCFIPFDTRAPLNVYAFRKYAATVTISVVHQAKLGIIRGFKTKATLQLRVVSNEYIGWFWNPDEPQEDTWVPDVPPSNVWGEVPKNPGFWTPLGPDMRPNWDG